MMEHMRTWLFSVVLMAFSAGLVQEIVPKGRERVLVRLVGGVLIALAVLKPLCAVNCGDFQITAGEFADKIMTETENFRVQRTEQLSLIIAKRTEAYIGDKATELGLDCTVRVYVSAGGRSVPVPETVELGIKFDPVLSIWIEEVIGIPAEKQIWLEASVWERKQEND